MFRAASRQFVAALLLIALSFNLGVHFVHATLAARAAEAMAAGTFSAGEADLLAALTQICTRAGLAGSNAGDGDRDGTPRAPIDPCFVCLHFVAAGLVLLAFALLGANANSRRTARPRSRTEPHPRLHLVSEARGPPAFSRAV